MITIATDSEARLRVYLKTIAADCASWRAVTCHQPHKSGVATAGNLKAIVSSIVVQHLAGQDGGVFILADQDIVVLCRGAARKNLDDLARDLNTFFAAPPPDNQDICRVYDLSVTWNDLESWCAPKLETSDRKPVAVAAAQEKSAAPSAATKIIMDKTFTSQIPVRRSQRKDTVVLLVEDDPVSMRLARRTLTANYEVVAAEDGASAREAYAFNAPTIAFLDIGLPDTTGHEVLKELQAIDPSAYIVMLSANSYQQDIVKAMQSGAKGFICKPFTVAKLMHYIAQAEIYHAGGQRG